MMPFEKNMPQRPAYYGSRMVGIIACILLATFIAHNCAENTRAAQIAVAKESFDRQVAQAKEQLEFRPEVLMGVLGLPLLETCDDNGTANDSGDIHCATLDGYRVWKAGGYTHLGTVSIYNTVEEVLKVRPEYVYGSDRSDYQFNTRMDWQAARKALDAFREAQLSKLEAVESGDLHVLTKEELDFLRTRTN